MKTFVTLAALAATVSAGTTIWSGSFNSYPSSASFDNWSWSNQVGEYQWYIHGSSATSSYLSTGASYKNPADTAESVGLKLTIDSSSHWNGQTMQRTEIIPQTSVSIATGTLFYHFSIMHSATNPPSAVEHQIMFFESHFTELKYGVGSNPTDLQWFVSGVSKWSTPWTAGTWFNFAYEIDFSGNTVALWASTGGAALTKVVSAVSTSASSNSADFHVGVLAFGSSKEDYYLSGVYVESGPITTAIGSGSSVPATTTAKVTTSTPTSSTSQPVSTTSSAAGAAQTRYGQCGGTGYTGLTNCGTYTCVAVSPPFYYQCQ